MSSDRQSPEQIAEQIVHHGSPYTVCDDYDEDEVPCRRCEDLKRLIASALREADARALREAADEMEREWDRIEVGPSSWLRQRADKLTAGRISRLDTRQPER